MFFAAFILLDIVKITFNGAHVIAFNELSSFISVITVPTALSVKPTQKKLDCVAKPLRTILNWNEIHFSSFRI